MNTIVDDIVLIPNILDGGGPVRCVCAYIWRRVPNDPVCPSCGRSAHSVSVSMDEYRASRR